MYNYIYYLQVFLANVNNICIMAELAVNVHQTTDMHGENSS